MRLSSISGAQRLLAQRRQFLKLRPTCTIQNLTARFQTTKALGDKLRVAIVGGSVAGLSAALHLAPLVEQGLVAAPIDVFDVVDDSKTDRDIGVGLWTTAIESLANSQRVSHEQVFDTLTNSTNNNNKPGTTTTWLDQVGYRTPNGAWLMQSQLPTTWDETLQRQMPGLLFLRERDLIGTLQRAVHWEEQLGTLHVHRNTTTSLVSGVAPGELQQPWSSKLQLGPKSTTTESISSSSSPTTTGDRDYHLIVAADGTHSNLRRTYGGMDSILSSPSSVGAPLAMDEALSTGSSNNNSSNTAAHTWNDANHQQAVGLQDRNYTVFRGNAQISADELAALDSNSSDGRISFQTWGTHNSMRFATVPMQIPQASSSSSSPSSEAQQSSAEHQVWFITVNDATLAQEQALLGEGIYYWKNTLTINWHDPIAGIVQATDPETILMERAIAHRHCMGPILNLNKVLQRIGGGTDNHNNNGPGPAVVFLGDAYMTIDPILAQGFTVAMEGSANLYQSLHRALSQEEAVPPSPLAFDPYVLRDELVLRHESRMGRLVCLLRATELVQALGQPEGASLVGGLNTHVLRPLVGLCPNFA
eukprot:CAMPEP_0168754658 /NCGR_PEP_ID=MMETSP0724-20121128/19622_1 /TAXON_ID=265536 /ORGANISM="Amphiprora sp., Strain CCMP467" /LENGTH=587 /DNA_ID=CAMNT_0008803159 /DNA_START=29 /DNA_END=1789 /DNA_ORIENTATION=+